MVCPHMGTIRVVLHLERGVYFQIARVYAMDKKQKAGNGYHGHLNFRVARLAL